MRAQKGIFEKIPGSGIWWIRYAEATGRIRREKAGNKGTAIKLYSKRKTEVLQGKKLPESLRQRVITITELAKDALEYVRANNAGHEIDAQRIQRLVEKFGHLPAEPPPIEEFRRWFQARTEWKPSTFNHYLGKLSVMYRLGIENKKVSCQNPARLIKRKREDNGRVRWLDAEEEQRLRQVIEAKFPAHMPEFDVAIQTGMRRSEQYQRISWECVDLLRRDLKIPQTKNGLTRHVSLSSDAVAAFQVLFQRSKGEGPVFVGARGEPLLSPRHWFVPAVKEAGIKGFTWHDIRHTFASRLVMAGVDLTTVKELLGHKTIQMTCRYAHLAQSHKLAAVEKLSGGWKPQEGPTDTKTSTDQESQAGSESRTIN